MTQTHRPPHIDVIVPITAASGIRITATSGVVLRTAEGQGLGALCPDHLRLDDLGAADTWRGRVVRALFWALERWR